LKKPLLITIVGPTAVGKTSIAIEIAKQLETIILSVDSRQFFKETTVGTAKPSAEQMTLVPHYFIDNLSIHDFYSVGDFEREALSFLETHFLTQPFAIAVGGSGLYVNALLYGMDELPQVPESLRNEITQEIERTGLASLIEELKKADPVYFDMVDKNNPQRIVRAIEVFRHTGIPISSFWKKNSKERFFDSLVIGIKSEREALYQTINERVDHMISEGLLEEAQKLYPHRELYALQTVGYKEVFAHLDGDYDRVQTIELIKRNTRRYAKRQLTWFRRDASIHWFYNHDIHGIQAFIQGELHARGIETP
jgi:tRNA dimethylallyltransferase